MNVFNGFPIVSFFSFSKHRLNASFVYHNVMKKNDSYITYIIDEYLEKRKQFSLNLFLYYSELYQNQAEVSNSFESTAFSIVTMKLGSEDVFSSWLKTELMSTNVKLLLLASIIIFIFLFKLLSSAEECLTKLKKRTDFDSGMCSIIISAFRTFFGDSLTKLPSSSSIRIILIAWVLYCFLVTSLITAKLLSSLVQPDELDNIQTIDELLESDLTILAPKEVRPIMEALMEKNLWRKLSKRLNTTVNWNEFKDLMSRKESKCAYIAANYFTSYIVHKYIDKETNKPIYYELSEKVFQLPAIYSFEQGSPYLNRINTLLGRLNEFGFFQHWHQLAIYNMSLATGYFDEDEEDDEPQNQKVILKLNNFKEVFLTWAFGMIAASCIFILEWARKLSLDLKLFQN